MQMEKYQANQIQHLLIEVEERMYLMFLHNEISIIRYEVEDSHRIDSKWEMQM